MNYLEKNKDITHLSNFKTPAFAKYFFELHDIQEIKKIFEIYTWAQENKVPILFISGGTNMLFAFDEFPWVVIHNCLLWWNYNQQSKILHTQSAEKIWNIAQSLEVDYNQDLWHRFIGLPGTIAGAIYGNAGCFGLETENNFLSCQVLDLENGQVSTFYKKDMNFSYRNSILKQEKKYFVISAEFDLSQKIEKYHSEVDNIDFRENKQPKWNSCGSFFKNPNKDQSAGFLIESVGLKGYHIGGAYFSQQHANFLMHDGNGKYQDLLALIEMAQNKVLDQYGIELIPEVQIITP